MRQGAGPVVIGRVKIAREAAKWTPEATRRGNCKKRSDAKRDNKQSQFRHLIRKTKWQRIIDKLETEAKPGRLQAKHGPIKSPSAGTAQSCTFVSKLRNFLGCVESASRHRCSGSLALQHRNHIRLGRIATGAAWLPAPSCLCAVQHDRRRTDRKTRQQQGAALGTYRPCRWMYSALALKRKHGITRNPGDWRIHCRRQRAGTRHR